MIGRNLVADDAGLAVTPEGRAWLTDTLRYDHPAGSRRPLVRSCLDWTERRPHLAGALGAAIWAIRNPREGLREADQLDFRQVLETARPYLGSLVGAYTDWTPLQGRGELFSEKLVADQPWLLQNVCARQWRS